MKKLLLKLSLFFTSVTAIFSLYAYVFVGGEDDSYYRRFTTPPSASLVVGSSRCAQGIVPEEIDKSSLEYTGEMFNYCFTSGHSPYGPFYLQSIQDKLGERDGGIFIIEVNPWIISVRSNVDPDNPASFRESERFINNMNIVNYMNPNMEYILRHYEGPYYKDIYFDILFGQSGGTYLLKSGWLRVNVSMDSSKVKNRKKVDWCIPKQIRTVEAFEFEGGIFRKVD